LIRGENVLPAAKQAMALVNPFSELRSNCTGFCLHPQCFSQLTKNQSQWLYPVCFMTNGGGMTEAAKALQLSDLLGVAVQERQVLTGELCG
jgi:hypothetical protein